MLGVGTGKKSSETRCNLKLLNPWCLTLQKFWTSKSTLVNAWGRRRFYCQEFLNCGNISYVQFSADIIPFLQTGKLKHGGKQHFMLTYFYFAFKIMWCPWILLFDATLCVMCKCRKAFMKFCPPNNCSSSGEEDQRILNFPSKMKILRSKLEEQI